MDFVQEGSGAAILEGAAIAYVMYGVTCCQAIWYFRTYPRDANWLKCLVAVVVLLESVQCAMMFVALWYYLIQRGIGEPQEKFKSCVHWSMTLGQTIPTEICCMLVESFFLRRMWKLSTQKKLAALAFIPLFAGWGITIAYLVDLYGHPCIEDIDHTFPLILAGTSVNSFTDLVIAISMSMILHKRRPDTTRHTNSLKILQSLMFRSLLSGTLMWISTMAVLVLFLAQPNDVFYIAAYFVHGKIYANTLLATLNSRKTLRWLPNATIELDIVPVTADPSRKTGHGHGTRTPTEFAYARTSTIDITRSRLNSASPVLEIK